LEVGIVAQPRVASLKLDKRLVFAECAIGGFFTKADNCHAALSFAVRQSIYSIRIARGSTLQA